jgi:phosphoserine phosphatase RsbU/P
VIRTRTVQVDLLSLSYLAFAIVMLAAMTVGFRRIKWRNQTIEQELAAASAVQHLLLSSASSSALAFAVETIYLPAGEVGGDFFHVEPGAGDDGALLIVVGDVSGKGLQAAMTVSTIVGALRGCVDRRPGEVLAYLNRVLYGQIAGFVTCCAARIETTGAVTLANAGMW